MSDRISYDYAIIRVVPRVERQEFVNVGVIVFSRERNYLAVKFDMALDRLAAMAPATDLAAVHKQLAGIEAICRGDRAAGYYCTLSKSERFNWLVAPASNIIQASAVHSGIFQVNDDQALNDLYGLLVHQD